MIPKIIHRIWIQGAEACPFRDNLSRCRQDAEGIQFRLWDDASIRPLFERLGRRGRALEAMYDAEPTYAGKSDIARYMIVYLSGGFYLDTDYRCVRSPALWIDAFGGKDDIDLVVVQSNNFHRLYRLIDKVFIQNGLFGASARHPVMENCLKTILGRKRGSLLSRTGPLMFGAIVMAYFRRHPQTTVLLPDAYLFPFMNLRMHKTIPANIRDLPLMDHENANSWVPVGQKMLLRLPVVYYAWFLVAVVALIVWLVLIATGSVLAGFIFLLVYVILVIVLYGLLMRWYTRPPHFPQRDTLHKIKKADATRLMIVCHPDDELLFGGLALLRLDGWKIICLTNAGHKRRAAEFVAAMDSLDQVWEYEMWDHTDQDTARRLHDKVEPALRRELERHHYEMVLTHNWKGEYGHAQHRLVGTLVPRLVSSGLWVFWDTQGGHGSASADERERLAALVKGYPSQARRARKHFRRAHRYWILRVA